MNKLNLGRDLYLKGRIGWRGLSKDEYLDNSGYKIINATALMDGYVDWNNCGFITKERYEESDEIMLKEGDILISKDGTLGKIGYVKGLTTPCTVASGIFVLRNTVPEILNFDYLYHVLKSYIFKDFIARNKVLGSTIPHLYQRDLENFELDLPDIKEQERIATILNSIDLKIANNTAISSDLEAMAKLLYDYWFVQFDFPDESGKPYKSSGRKMVWNEKLKREIPEGWEVEALSHYCSFENGDRGSNYPSGDDFIPEGIPFVAGGALKEHEIDYNELRYISEEKYHSLRAGKANRGDILMTLRGSLAKCVYSPFERMAIASALVITRPKNGVSREYLHRVLISDYYVQLLNNYDNGSVQANLSVDTVKSFPILFPGKTVMDIFTRNIEVLEAQEAMLRDENHQLASLRDFLLPMLMNGQVKIGKAGA